MGGVTSSCTPRLLAHYVAYLPRSCISGRWLMTTHCSLPSLALSASIPATRRTLCVSNAESICSRPTQCDLAEWFRPYEVCCDRLSCSEHGRPRYYSIFGKAPSLQLIGPLYSPRDGSSVRNVTQRSNGSTLQGLNLSKQCTSYYSWAWQLSYLVHEIQRSGAHSLRGKVESQSHKRHLPPTELPRASPGAARFRLCQYGEALAQK